MLYLFKYVYKGWRVLKEFKSVSIVILTVNEDSSLRKTVSTLLDTCNHEDIAELYLLVGSRATDNCLAAIEDIKASSTDVPVKVFRQTYPGIGANVNEFTMLPTGSHAICFSGDGNLDPTQVHTFIEYAKKYPDYLIVGSRWLDKDGFSGYDPFKKALNFAARIFLSVLFHTDRTEFTQPYQISPIEMIRNIKWEEKMHPLFIEVMMKPIRLGMKSMEIPTRWKKRTDGKPNRNVFYFLPYLKTALHVRFMKKSDILKPGFTMPEELLENKAKE